MERPVSSASEQGELPLVAADMPFQRAFPDHVLRQSAHEGRQERRTDFAVELPAGAVAHENSGFGSGQIAHPDFRDELIATAEKQGIWRKSLFHGAEPRVILIFL